MDVSGGIPITTSLYVNSQGFDVCKINGSKFAFFSNAIESEGNLTLDFTDYNVIFLAPMKAEENISIKAISVIAFSPLESKQGGTQVEASGKCILLGSEVESKWFNEINVVKGVFAHEIIKERKEMIIDEFKTGISQKNGLTIVQALTDTFDAIDDPSVESEDSTVDIAKAFEFFDIPSGNG